MEPERRRARAEGRPFKPQPITFSFPHNVSPAEP
jgi:hypothetical protein